MFLFLASCGVKANPRPPEPKATAPAAPVPADRAPATAPRAP